MKKLLFFFLSPFSLHGMQNRITKEYLVSVQDHQVQIRVNDDFIFAQCVPEHPITNTYLSKDKNNKKLYPRTISWSRFSDKKELYLPTELDLAQIAILTNAIALFEKTVYKSN